MMAFALHNIFLYGMAGFGGMLAGLTLMKREDPTWKRLLGLAFLLACIGVIVFNSVGM